MGWLESRYAEAEKLNRDALLAAARQRIAAKMQPATR